MLVVVLIVGALLVQLVDRQRQTARAHLEVYDLELREAVATVRHTVTRYLWVAGVFIFFLIVILNTRITAAYTDEAQDSFKWMMWVFLAGAVGVGVYGLIQYRAMRDLAITTHERVAADALRSGRTIARFLHRFLLEGEGPPPPRT